MEEKRKRNPKPRKAEKAEAEALIAALEAIEGAISLEEAKDFEEEGFIAVRYYEEEAIEAYIEESYRRFAPLTAAKLRAFASLLSSKLEEDPRS